MTTHPRRGGDVRKAPEGFYTAKQAWTRLQMSKQTFYERIKDGLIQRVVLPGWHDGFYSIEEINLLATLREQGIVTHSRMRRTTFRQATAKDAVGVADVLTSLGWEGAPADLLIKWYGVNPEIHHIVVQGAFIMGYISAIPFTDEVMEKRLRGQIESAEVKARDILPFEDNHEYNLFVGIAERRKPKVNPERYAKYGLRLVLGFRRFLMEDLYKRGIRIKLLLAHSAEEDGQKLASALGFVPQPYNPQKPDRYPIYILDMEHSDALWVQKYRELWKEQK